MHAYLHSTRLAPKKANIMAKMVRGMSVPDAMELLRKTSKKSARLFEQLLRSAIANAEHNFKQDAQRMIVKTVVVNQGQHYQRGLPMARGRVRPIKKFMSHISLTLGHEGMMDAAQPMKHDKKRMKTGVKAEKSTSVAATKKTPKASTSTKAKTPKKASKSSASSESSVSSPSSN